MFDVHVALVAVPDVAFFCCHSSFLVRGANQSLQRTGIGCPPLSSLVRPHMRIMTREDFKAHVEKIIESVIETAEQRVGQKLPRHYCFNWISSKKEPVPQEQVSEFITEHCFVDSEHIFPCFDLGIGEMLDDGRLLLVGYRASFTPRPWEKGFGGKDGPFIRITGQKFLDRYHVA